MGKRTGLDLRAGLAANRRARRAGFTENEADYTVGLSANSAGAANLAAQLSRLQKGLAGVNARTVTTLAQQVAAAKRASRATVAAEGKTVSRYGTALAGTAADAYAPAGARNAAAVANARAAAMQGASVSKLGGVVAGIAAEGAVAQQAAGAYMLSQAFAARNAITAETFAQLQGDLYSKALDYQMQWELWKKQTDYAEKKAEDTERPAVKRIASEAPGIAADAGDLIRENVTGEDGKTMSDLAPGTLAATWAAENGYGDGEMQLMAATLRNMKAGQNAGPAIQNAISTLYGDMDGFNHWGDDLLGAVEAGANTEWTARYTNFQEESSPTGEDRFADLRNLVDVIGREETIKKLVAAGRSREEALAFIKRAEAATPEPVLPVGRAALYT